MKLALMNFSGKVGKSTLCNTFAYPRMQDATIIKMEAINDSELSSTNKEQSTPQNQKQNKKQHKHIKKN